MILSAKKSHPESNKQGRNRKGTRPISGKQKSTKETMSSQFRHSTVAIHRLQATEKHAGKLENGCECPQTDHNRAVDQQGNTSIFS